MNFMTVEEYLGNGVTWRGTINWNIIGTTVGLIQGNNNWKYNTRNFIGTLRLGGGALIGDACGSFH